MKPKDMPEPDDGTRVIVIGDTLALHTESNVGVYHRDDARAEEESLYPEDQHWFDGGGTDWAWGDVTLHAVEVYTATLTAKE